MNNCTCDKLGWRGNGHSEQCAHFIIETLEATLAHKEVVIGHLAKTYVTESIELTCKLETAREALERVAQYLDKEDSADVCDKVEIALRVIA